MKLTVVLTIFAISLFSLNSGARTLQSLAQLSNALLVLAEQATPNTVSKACKLSSQQISEKSQALHILIDEKSQALTEGDFKILSQRADTCDKDCTCDIYAYALEKRERPIQAIADKAAKTQIEDRQKCMRAVKNLCTQIKALK